MSGAPCRIVCPETGESWNSVKACAEAENISYRYMRQQVRLGRPIRGKHYKVAKRLHPKKAHRVRCVETGEEFPTMSEACKSLGHHDGYCDILAKACNDWELTFAGFHWEWA